MPVLRNSTHHHPAILPFLGRSLHRCRRTGLSPFPATKGAATIHGECGSSPWYLCSCRLVPFSTAGVRVSCVAGPAYPLPPAPCRAAISSVALT